MLPPFGPSGRFSAFPHASLSRAVFSRRGFARASLVSGALLLVASLLSHPGSYQAQSAAGDLARGEPGALAYSSPGSVAASHSELLVADAGYGLSGVVVSKEPVSGSRALVHLGGTSEDSVLTALEKLAGPDALAAVTVVEKLSALSIDTSALADMGVPAEALAEALGEVSVTQQPEPLVWALSTSPPNDPFWSQQWGLQTVGITAAWERTFGSDEIVVAVLDTGVSPVSELSGRLLAGWNFVEGTSDTSDDNGHGTMSATVIAASIGNSSGIAGACGACKILPVRVLGSDGSGTHSSVAAGIVYAADQGAHIINLSLGGPTPSQLLDDAVAYARAAGALVVVSAGNDGVETLFYPAASPGTLSVAGTTQQDGRYSWSNFGAWVDVAAPGCNPAQSFDGLFYWYCGTSSAAPVVSGVAALALSYSVTLTALQLDDRELFTLLHETAVPLEFVESGRIDAAGLFAALDPASDEEPVGAPEGEQGEQSGEEDSPDPLPEPAGDTTPPQVQFLTPSPGKHIRGVVQVTASASDDTGLTALELWHELVRLGEASQTEQAVTVDTAALADGPVTLRWRAHDGAGNVTVVSRQFTVDNTAPQVAFASPAAGTYHAGWLTVTPNVADANLHRVDLYVGADRISSAWEAPWELFLDTRTLPDGPVELRLRAHDVAGNVSVVSRTVAAANGSVSAAILWPNPGRHVQGEAGVTTTFQGPAPIAATALLVDGVEVRAWPYLPAIASLDTNALDEGQRSLQLRVTDQAGRQTFSPTRVVTVDRTPPELTVISPNPGGTLAPGGLVRVDAFDPAGLRRLELWVGDALADTLPFPSSGVAELSLPSDLAAGQTLLRVVALDNLGNRRMVGRVASVVAPEPDPGQDLEGEPAAFFLADNGLTVLCPGVDVGESFALADRTFTRRTAEQIRGDVSLAESSCTTGVQDLSQMFYGASLFDGDVSHWDTSLVTSMSSMFRGASSFNQPLGGWDVSSVESMENMFHGASSFNAFNRPVDDWDVSSVVSMAGMFHGAASFNQQIGLWDVASVTDMAEMFLGAASFDQDLSGWCVQGLADPPEGFDSGAAAWAAPRPVWGTCG